MARSIRRRRARAIFIRFALTEGDFETRASCATTGSSSPLSSTWRPSRGATSWWTRKAIRSFHEERGRWHRRFLLFERWLRQASRKDPKLLYLRLEDAMRHEAAVVTAQAFPDHFQVGATALRLEYRFDPGQDG